MCLYGSESLEPSQISSSGCDGLEQYEYIGRLSDEILT